MSKITGSSLYLGSKFLRAVRYVRDLHIEARKETDVPYLAHLMGVASIVMGENGYLEFPVTEDMVVAALLHDSAEDWGGRARLEDVRRTFGADVARIVDGCTDTFEDPKPSWKPRKEAYIRRLADEAADTRLVSAADKLYNARAILEDYRVVSDLVWKRFNRGRSDQLWYFTELIRTFRSKGTNRIVEELARAVQELERVSGTGT